LNSIIALIKNPQLQKNKKDSNFMIFNNKPSKKETNGIEINLRKQVKKPTI
jgi:hypothetical protein